MFILPNNKSPGKREQFLGAFQQGMNAIAQYNEQEKAKKLMADENKQLQNMGLDLQGIKNPDFRKLAFQNFLDKQKENQKFENEYSLNQLKNMGKEQEGIIAKDTAQKAFNEMAGLIKHLGRGSGIMSLFGGDTAKKSGQFTSLNAALESLLVHKVNTGALSDSRFRYITEELLPKPYDTQDTIKGKLEGLAQVLDLDPSSLSGAPSKNKEMTNRPDLKSFLRKK